MIHYYTINVKNLAGILQKQRLKKWWVAEQAGIHKTTLRRWLNGEIQKVKSENILRLAAVLTTSAASIAVPIPSARTDHSGWTSANLDLRKRSELRFNALHTLRKSSFSA